MKRFVTIHFLCRQRFVRKHSVRKRFVKKRFVRKRSGLNCDILWKINEPLNKQSKKWIFTNYPFKNHNLSLLPFFIWQPIFMLLFFCLFSWGFLKTILNIDFDSYIPLELTRVNQDWNIFSKNVELTPTFSLCKVCSIINT